MPEPQLPSVRMLHTPVLELVYQEWGDVAGEPVVLLHGFPYDPRSFDAVAPALAARGMRVIVPYLRGYGPTRFRSASTMRSGQQGALAQDLLDLLDGLGIARTALAGYDWGGRAACIVAALFPERVRCLVTGDGYNIHDIAGFAVPQPPAIEHRLWYQYYLHSPRGRAGLHAHRHEFGELLWRLWSPNWRFTPQEYARTARSFDNPDFVDVVIHSYRHRYGLVVGDAAYAGIEARLAAQPSIAVPAITIDGDRDGVNSGTSHHASKFVGKHEHRVFAGAGHNLPQERPEDFARAVFDAAAMALG